MKNKSKDGYDEILISDIGKRRIKLNDDDRDEVEKLLDFLKINLHSIFYYVSLFGRYYTID